MFKIPKSDIVHNYGKHATYASAQKNKYVYDVKLLHSMQLPK